MHPIGISLGGLVAYVVVHHAARRVRSLDAVGEYRAGDLASARSQRGELPRRLPMILFAMPRIRRDAAATSTVTAAGRQRFLEGSGGLERASFAALRDFALHPDATSVAPLP